MVGAGKISWDFTGRKGGSHVPRSTRIDAKLKPYMGSATKTLLRS